MAQMESGLTMQLLNHSRAASGAEHLMAHLVELHPPRFEKAEGIHGECVGVGTFFECIKVYHELAKKTPKAKPFQPLTEEWVREKVRRETYAGHHEGNENDVLATFPSQNIVDHWDEIRERSRRSRPLRNGEALRLPLQVQTGGHRHRSVSLRMKC